MAVVLMPELPLEGWLEQLDAQLARSPKFFEGRAVVLDLAPLAGHEADFPDLVASLAQRDIRLVGVEGADVARFGDRMPPLLAGGRHVAVTAEEPPPPELEPKPPEAPSLLVDHAVRSGQSINHPTGDVTILGSVASGSEIVAGGSIHIYGTLRGRAIAGLLGPRGRIFCRRLEAELLAIDGVYLTADEMAPSLQGRAVQAWLEGGALSLAALD